MFKSCSFLRDRPPLLAFIALHMPPEASLASREGLRSAEGEHWALDTLLVLQEDLGVEEKHLLAYLPLLPCDYSQASAACAQAFLTSLPLSYPQRVDLLLRLLLCLLSAQRYDGRGRSLIRSLAGTFGIEREDFLLVEGQLGLFLQEQGGAVPSLLHRKKKLTKRERYVRYAKIGAVSLSAGAVLAVTGGLAAPAVAGALLVMGGGGAAAAVSATSLAALFGSTGLGLTTYKMMRRTRGLSEFKFERVWGAGHGEEGGQIGGEGGEEELPSSPRMAVMVLVGGWMEKEGDDYRAWGFLPPQMGLLERGRRVCQLHCPEREGEIEEEYKNYEETPDIFLERLREILGEERDPMDPRHLLPPLPPPPASSPQAIEAVRAVLGELEGGRKGGVFRFLRRDSAPPAYATASPSAPFPSSSAPVPPSPPDSPRGSKGGEEGGLEYASLSSLLSSPPLARPQSQAGRETEGKGKGGLEEEEERKAGEPLPPSAEIGEEEVQRLLEEVRGEASPGPAPCPRYWHFSSLPAPLSGGYEVLLLRWETALQRQLGGCIGEMVRQLSTSVVQNLLSATLFTSLAVAVMWPVLLIKLTDVIDNLWTIAIERADQAGRELARALLRSREGGKTGGRPVTLVGYSLGARAVYSCLKELSLLLHKASPSLPAPPADPSDLSPASASASAPAQPTPAPPPSLLQKGEGFSYDLEEEVRDFPPAPMPASAPAPAPSSSSSSSSVSAAPQAVLKSLGQGVAWLAGGAGVVGGSGKGGETEPPPSAESDPAPSLSPLSIKSLIGDVVLLGTPISPLSPHWPLIREVVGGRLVNGFSPHDLVLSLLYRYQRVKFTVAGVGGVSVEGVENVDLSDIVRQHTDYPARMKDILERINLQ